VASSLQQEGRYATTTIDRIAAIVAEMTNDRNVGAIAGDTVLDHLGLDSLECIELTVAVEDAFNVDIHCGERISFVTVGCIAHLVDAQLAERLPLAA